MENRPLSVAACLMLACMAAYALPGRAATGDADGQRADWEARLEKSRALQMDGEGRRKKAQEELEAGQKACFKKFRVNACQREVRQQYVREANEGRRLVSEGKALERQVRKEQLADKEGRRAREAAAEEAELQAREAETRAERQRAESRQEEKLEAKEKDMRAGAAQRAAREERQRRKQESHEKKMAEKMAKARQRAGRNEAAEAGSQP